MARICEDKYPKKFSYNQKPGFYMEDVLKDQIDILLKNIKNDWDFTILITGGGEVRVGKCQPKGSKVLMANGKWKNIENIKKGEEVIAPSVVNGYASTAKVQETTNYFSDEIYNIYSKSNSKQKLYSCSGNHLIPIQIIKSKRKGRKNSKTKKIITNMSAKELFMKSNSWLRNNSVTTFQGHLIKTFNKFNCNIDPYTLGVFLGDGSFHSERKKRKLYKGSGYNGRYGKYKGHWLTRHISITSANEEMMKEISKIYPIMSITSKNKTNAKSYNFSINSNFVENLQKLNLEGIGSGNKFIPESAKLSDMNYRLSLLAGLIDSDGYISKDGHAITITSKSLRLVKDIQEVCRSLGGNTKIRKIKKQIKSLNFEGNYYSVQINLGKLQNKIPLINKFKLNRLRKITQFKTNISFTIKKVKGTQVYGIILNNKERLYITDNFCVTHNSVLAMQIGAYWTYMIKKLYGKICPFGIETNFVFDGKKLIEIGNRLGQKYSYPVLIYDEAGADLEGRKIMQTITQDVLDFFRECGQYNMFNIIVLPEFFDLPKGIALSRSIFLIDVSYLADDEGIFHRGYFNFYSRPNKKYLYLKGKKELNYKAYQWDFHGRFGHFYPINEKEYRAGKQEALTKRESRRRNKFQMQRDACWYLLNQELGWKQSEICKRMEQLTGIYIAHATMSDGVKHYMMENE